MANLLRIQRLREARQRSQGRLVEELVQQGFDMHQTTVAKLEAGKRPLRVAELMALAAIFEISPADFLAEPENLRETYRLQSALLDRARANRDLLRAVKARETAQARMGAAAGGLLQRGLEPRKCDGLPGSCGT